MGIVTRILRRAAAAFVLGIAWSILAVGGAAVIVASGGGMSASRAGRLTLATSAALLGAGLGGVVLLFLGLGLRRVGRGLRQLSATAAMCADPRPPVLLLRAFFRDAESAGPRQEPLLPMLPLAGVGALRSTDAMFSTMEEQIVAQLATFGPVVAIGRPGDRLSPVGAARLYVAEEGDWKREVLALAERATFIVVMVDQTDGLKWELATLVSREAIAKLVLLLPRGRTETWWKGWSALAEEWPILPRDADDSTVAVSFDETGAPHCYDAHSPVGAVVAPTPQLLADYLVPVRVAACRVHQRRTGAATPASETPVGVALWLPLIEWPAFFAGVQCVIGLAAALKMLLTR